MDYYRIAEQLKEKIENAEYTARLYKSCTDGSYELCMYKVERLKEIYNKVLDKLRGEE